MFSHFKFSIDNAPSLACSRRDWHLALGATSEGGGTGFLSRTWVCIPTSSHSDWSRANSLSLSALWFAGLEANSQPHQGCCEDGRRYKNTRSQAHNRYLVSFWIQGTENTVTGVASPPAPCPRSVALFRHPAGMEGQASSGTGPDPLHGFGWVRSNHSHPALHQSRCLQGPPQSHRGLACAQPQRSPVSTAAWATGGSCHGDAGPAKLPP